MSAREVSARAINGFSDCDGEAGFRACVLCTCRSQADAILAALDAAGKAVVERNTLLEALRLLRRYRNETPLGHQPHMIAHEADALLAAAKGGER